MLSTVMHPAAFTVTSPDPLASAIEHYRSVESYRVAIHSIHVDGEEHLRYYYKKPGFVRMEFIRPHAGTVLIYSPYTHDVRLWPFGINHFPEINLSPDNPQIQTSRGQRVDHSDVGTLFKNVYALRADGNAKLVGEESIDSRTVVHLIVTGADGFAIDGVHRYELWLDTASQFPVKVISRDRQNASIETVIMETPEINTTLPETLFDP